MGSGENSVALKQDCVENFQQCPNKGYNMNQPFMIWPHTKGVILPTIGVVEDDTLVNNFSAKVDSTGFIGFNDDKHNKYKLRLKEMYGWKRPTVRLYQKDMKQGCCVARHFLWYDAESQAPVK